jgi:hypothetical protein
MTDGPMEVQPRSFRLLKVHLDFTARQLLEARDQIPGQNVNRYLPFQSKQRLLHKSGQAGNSWHVPITVSVSLKNLMHVSTAVGIAAS